MNPELNVKGLLLGSWFEKGNQQEMCGINFITLLFLFCFGAEGCHIQRYSIVGVHRKTKQSLHKIECKPFCNNDSNMMWGKHCNLIWRGKVVKMHFTQIMIFKAWILLSKWKNRCVKCSVCFYPNMSKLQF